MLQGNSEKLKAKSSKRKVESERLEAKSQKKMSKAEIFNNALVFKLFAFSFLLLLQRLVLKSICRIGLA
jgi:hypothetical protein